MRSAAEIVPRDHGGRASESGGVQAPHLGWSSGWSAPEVASAKTRNGHPAARRAVDVHSLRRMHRFGSLEVWLR